jgi:hypothetical protein
VKPSFVTLKGSKRLGEIITTNVWGLRSPLDGDRPLQDHLEWLVEELRPRYERLGKIKSSARIDVFCSLTSPEQSGLSLSPKALSIFHDLQINMEVSIISA